jgi:hypothetical protein
MPPYQFISWIDTWALSAALRTKLNKFEQGICPVRKRDNGWLFELRKEWPSLWNTLRRLQAHPLGANTELGDVAIIELRPHSEREWLWLPADDSRWVELQVALVCNPQTYLFVGTQPVHLPIGHVCVINRGYARCAVNWGESPLFRLICELRGAENAHNDTDITVQ